MERIGSSAIDKRQVATVAGLEGVAHLIGPEDLASLDVADRQADALMALRREQAERVADIFGGDRRAVGERRFLAQLEGDALLVGGEFGGLGDQAIDGIGLVIGARHQRVEQQAQALRRIALEDVVVEASRTCRAPRCRWSRSCRPSARPD